MRFKAAVRERASVGQGKASLPRGGGIHDTSGLAYLTRDKGKKTRLFTGNNICVCGWWYDKTWYACNTWDGVLPCSLIL